MKLKYKATLYESKDHMEYLFLTQSKREELNKPRPVDTALLDKKCYKTAERHFFSERGWVHARGNYHVEIEDKPRVIEE